MKNISHLEITHSGPWEMIRDGGITSASHWENFLCFWHWPWENRTFRNAHDLENFSQVLNLYFAPLKAAFAAAKAAQATVRQLTPAEGLLDMALIYGCSNKIKYSMDGSFLARIYGYKKMVVHAPIRGAR